MIRYIWLRYTCLKTNVFLCEHSFLRSRSEKQPALSQTNNWVDNPNDFRWQSLKVHQPASLKATEEREEGHYPIEYNRSASKQVPLPKWNAAVQFDGCGDCLDTQSGFRVWELFLLTDDFPGKSTCPCLFSSFKNRLRHHWLTNLIMPRIRGNESRPSNLIILLKIVRNNSNLLEPSFKWDNYNNI